MRVLCPYLKRLWQVLDTSSLIASKWQWYTNYLGEGTHQLWILFKHRRDFLDDLNNIHSTCGRPSGACTKVPVLLQELDKLGECVWFVESGDADFVNVH